MIYVIFLDKEYVKKAVAHERRPAVQVVKEKKIAIPVG